jgi:glycosyltransferase involved in cell wall biosynthesis
MTGHPTVSVIMAAYNHAGYIAQAIASVLSQSWQDFELIIIDDGSTDRTQEVVAGFGDSVRYIYQANQGQGGARTIGIAHARGEFVSFLDDDDLWLPNCLETVMTILQPRPEVGALYAACQVIDSEGNRLPQIMSRVVKPGEMYETLVEGGWFPPLVVTVRKSVLDDVGPLDLSLRGTDDWELWLRVAKKYPFMGISDVIASYRMHGGGLSANTEHMLADKKKAITKHFGPEEGNPAEWPGLRRRAYGGAYRLAGLAHMEARNMADGQTRLKQALLYYPEFARRIDFFYELACGFQPRGYRGDFGSLNLQESEEVVLDTMRFVFDSAETTPVLRTFKNIAYAHAYLALGMLAYGVGHMQQSRTYMIRAVKADPAIVTDRRLVSRYIKSFAGRRVLNTLRQYRRQVDHSDTVNDHARVKL